MKEIVTRNRYKLEHGFNLGIDIPIGFRIYQFIIFGIIFIPFLALLIGE